MKCLIVIVLFFYVFATFGHTFYDSNDRKPNESTLDMVFIKGGDFLMGSDNAEAYSADGEGPVRQVNI